MGLTGLVALAIVAVAVVLVVRGWDVRLVLLAAALTIAVLSGIDRPPDKWHFPLASVVREFLSTFSNEKFVVPICSAMGFAYVLRHTGCERHLVLLLVKPIRYVRFLMVPGVVLVGFLVNIPVISQTSTAVCIGPVVVPLMRAAGYSMATVGACLLLGASVGGELLNPGAPELLTVYDKTGVSTVEQAQRYLPPLVFTQLAVAGAVCWLMSMWWERRQPQPIAEEPTRKNEKNSVLSTQYSVPDKPSLPSENGERQPQALGEPTSAPSKPSPPSENGEGDKINLLKALVPLVPLLLLFATGLPKEYRLVTIPEQWIVKPEDAKQYNSRLIGLAMLVGVLTAMAVSRDKARDCVKHFFEGAGYGFAVIVSLIVTANCFGAAIREAGLADALGRLIAAAPGLMQPLAALVPLVFAAISGSGMASTQSLYGFFHDPAKALGLDPVSVGALVSLGAAAGRTMSPVAAVTLMCGTLTGTNPFTLAKRVAVPLLTGIAVVIALRMCGVL